MDGRADQARAKAGQTGTEALTTDALDPAATADGADGHEG